MSYPLSALMPKDAIRRARQDEAGEIARMFLISSDGLAAYIWSRMNMPGKFLLEIGTERYARTGTAFSFENCWMALRWGTIAGMVHAFPMEEGDDGENETDPVLKPYAELEVPGSFYVSGLAVREPFRGQGLGRQLMMHVYEHARSLKLTQVSLICFERNEAAMAFYRSEGFHEVDCRPIVPHPTLRYKDGDAVLLCRTC